MEKSRRRFRCRLGTQEALRTANRQSGILDLQISDRLGQNWDEAVSEAEPSEGEEQIICFNFVETLP